MGATTAFFAATSGLVQNDLKRIIAFSTISQLGYHCVFLIFSIFLFSGGFLEQALLPHPATHGTEGIIPLSLLRLEEVAGKATHRSSLSLIKFKYPFLPVVKHPNLNSLFLLPAAPQISRSCSTLPKGIGVRSPLNPWYITGFIDAEGTFSLTVASHKASQLR